MFKFATVLSFALAAAASAIAAPPAVADALFDGKCTYPKADPKFDVTKFTGRWYQVAATDVIFTKGCSCVFAEYSLNPNGNVNVLNTCQQNGKKNALAGSAAAVDKKYGEKGVLRVTFPGIPKNDPCAGPNYIVQEFNGDWAIVQAGNFSTLFILSRKQNVPAEQLDAWLKRAGELGSDLSKVSKTPQTDCKFT